MNTTDKRRIKFQVTVCGVLCALAAAGCNNLNQRSIAQSDDAASIAEVAQAVPLAAPRPTPTPDPLLAFRRAHQIPDWAKKKIINDVRVRPGEKVIALTFDDGPWPTYTRRILSTLAEHDVKATFFFVGSVVREHPDIAREVRDAGHVIGNHSWNHPSRPRDATAQVRNTNKEIEKVLGLRPTLFRPPYGMVKNGMAQQAMKDGGSVILWSADSNDWKRRSASQIANTVLRQSSPGGIILLHDGGGHRAATAAALPEIITTLRARGYRFVTMPELLRLRYVPPAKKAPVKKTPVKKATPKATR